MLTRCDLLDHWLAHGDITRPQFEAGRRFERLYRRAALDGLAVIDLDRPRVGGSYRQDAAAEQALTAHDDLKLIRAALGGMDFALVCRVLGRGEALVPANTKPDEKRYRGRRLREALAQLAVRSVHTG